MSESMSYKQTRRPIQSIVIVGGGLLGWTAAAGLARKLMRPHTQNNKPRIQVIETGSETAFFGESTLTSLHHFHRFLGLKERPLMSATNATFKLANEYVNWSAENPETESKSFFHADSPYGSMIDSVSFQHHLTKLRQMGESYDLTELSLPALAAREGKFKHPGPGQKSLPFSYSLHIDAHAYARGMRVYAEQLGVESFQSDIKNIELVEVQADADQESTLHIGKLILESSSEIEAELFVDCTTEGRLIGGELGVEYIDWSGYLPCDRYLTTLTTSEKLSKEPSGAHTKMQLHDSGWYRSFPLQTGTVYEYFYSSSHQSDEDAIQSFAAITGNPAIADQTEIKSQKPGRRKAFWQGNCVAIGNAAGGIDRLAASDFHLVQSATLRLLDLMPDNSLGQSAKNVSRDEYNALCAEEYGRVLDFHTMHFALSARAANDSSSLFWQKTLRADLPPSLSHKLSLFEQTGHFPFYERETFSDKTWISLMLGLNLLPNSYQATLDMPQANMERSRLALGKISEIAHKTVAAMPSHREYLNQYCPPLKKAQHSSPANNGQSASEPMS